MSKLRDMKYVKMIAKLAQSGDIMDNACRMILSDVELKLRVLIVVTKKSETFSLQAVPSPPNQLKPIYS